MAFNLDIILGALLVGTWANSVLYTVEVIQAAYYYRHFKHDDWMLKLLVSSTIAIDSVSMIANYASVYLYTITHYGDLAYLQSQYWENPLYIFTTGVVAALAQGFLAAKYWLLTKNKFISFALFFFIMVATGGAFASGVTIATFPAYKDRRRVIIPATIWFVTEAVTDISIALALLLEFRKVKSPFKETRNLLNRLVAQTIQTGAAGATVALAILVAFLANNESNVPTGIAYCLGRVYCLTMLTNLNVRKTVNSGPSKGTPSGANPGTPGERENQERSNGDDYSDILVVEFSGFWIDPSLIFPRKVDIDASPEFSMGSFNTNPGQGLPNDSPAVEVETTVNNSASYSSKKKQDLSAA
ncbi:hypothetical protein C8J57DRAFT_1513011 [Mycena rebaudengoi]|nr:hypothetical protein C8J57DRAFT_1513011 [Mycena rebaudengoi]